MKNSSESDVDTFCSQFDGVCQDCITHASCIFCQSNHQCISFPLRSLGVPPWSRCPPNLSSVNWVSCSISYAYLLALAVALLVFFSLLLTCFFVVVIRQFWPTERLHSGNSGCVFRPLRIWPFRRIKRGHRSDESVEALGPNTVDL
uniref:Pituitary tumor-transforming gene 1 protein-interacting protein n=1 Tax=Schistocephalus solidus TaxID=70667 RepID=A0A0X3Q0P8_SCHSO